MQAEAKAAVEQLCSVLGSLKDECKTLVDSYFDQIWKLLVQQAVSARAHTCVWGGGGGILFILSLSLSLSLSLIRIQTLFVVR